MSVSITGRHLKLSPQVREYIESKIPRLQKFSDKIQTLEFIVEKDRYQHVVELRLKAGPLEATGKTKDPDVQKAVDMLIDKIERQLVKNKARVRHDKDFRHAKTLRKPTEAEVALLDADDAAGGSGGVGVALVAPPPVATSKKKVRAAAGSKAAKADPRTPVAALASGKAKGKSSGTNRYLRAERVEPTFIEKLDVMVFDQARASVPKMTAEHAAEDLYFQGDHFVCFHNEDTGKLNIMYRRKDGHFALMEPTHS